MSKTALIVGSTGLVGSEVLQLLLNSNQYSKVISLQRSSALIVHPKLVIIQTDFTNLDEIVLPDIADAFCCLGTTIKKAGSKAAFEKVDLEIPFELAKRLIRSNLQNYIVISSMGANPDSYFFYNKVKGNLERKLSGLIDIPAISILRPGLLVGNRSEKRLAEGIAITISRTMKKITGMQFGIESADVARAMVHIAQARLGTGVQIYESKALKKLASM